MRMDLVQALKEILGSISSYKTRYEQVKQERDELKAEVEEAKQVAQQIKDVLGQWEP